MDNLTFYILAIIIMMIPTGLGFILGYIEYHDRKNAKQETLLNNA